MRKVLVFMACMSAYQTVLAADGTIKFNGSIVEPECVTIVGSQHSSITCSRDGQSKVKTILLSENQQPLPYNLGTVNVKTFNKNPAIKFLEVTYN